MCSLGLWVCEELMQKNIHQQVKNAINILGVTLKVSDHFNQGSFFNFQFDTLQLEKYNSKFEIE